MSLEQFWRLVPETVREGLLLFLVLVVGIALGPPGAQKRGEGQ
jgi:uncharacterized membrane protein YbjE (DUF340 family)